MLTDIRRRGALPAAAIAYKGNDNDPNELSTCRLVATGPLTFRSE